MLADGAGRVFLQPGAYAFRVEHVLAGQGHTVLALLEFAVTHNAEILLLLAFFAGLVLGHIEFFNILLR